MTTLQQYQQQVQSALTASRRDCEQLTTDCQIRFYRARKTCFMLFCETCGRAENHDVNEDED